MSLSISEKKIGYEIMVTSQVSGESLGQQLSVGSQLLAVQNSRVSIAKRKKVYSGRSTLHRQSASHLGSRERHQGMGLSVFIGTGNFIG